MSPSDKMSLNHLKIGFDDHGSPKYDSVLREERTRGDYDDLVRSLEADDSVALPSNLHDPLPCPSAESVTLDIDLGASAGIHAFFMEIGLYENKQRLVFMDNPFVELTNNGPDFETYLSDIKVYQKKGKCVASFVCNLDFVRGSKLAVFIRRIGDLGSDPFLRIPIIFNVLDPLIGFSPWALPDHKCSHDHELSIFDRGFHRPLLTHGGPHPNIVSYLVLKL